MSLAPTSARSVPASWARRTSSATAGTMIVEASAASSLPPLRPMNPRRPRSSACISTSASRNPDSPRHASSASRAEAGLLGGLVEPDVEPLLEDQPARRAGNALPGALGVAAEGPARGTVWAAHKGNLDRAPAGLA